jgi:hypothetical protein
MKKCTHKQTHPTNELSSFCKFFVGVEKHYEYNNIPLWILSCTCTTRCECLIKLRPDVVYIPCDAYEQNGPLQWFGPNHPNHWIYLYAWQIPWPSHTNKRRQIQPISKHNRSTRLEHIRLLIIIAAWVRAAIHTKNIDLLENLHIPTPLFYFIFKWTSFTTKLWNISHTSYLIRENSTINKNQYSPPPK